MGGDEDGGGCIDADKLISTIKEEFGMTIDIEKLIEEVDEDGSGEIEFEEFVELLTGGPWIIQVLVKILTIFLDTR